MPTGLMSIASLWFSATHRMVQVNPLDTTCMPTACFAGTVLSHSPRPERTNRFPGTLNASQTLGANSAQYPNTPDGLRDFLSGLREAEKSGDQAKVDSMIKQTEIPEYRNWFCSVYIPG